MYQEATVITRKRTYLLWLLLLSFLVAAGWTQETEQQLFQQGVEFYQRENYAKAQTTFLKILQQFPRGKLITATKLMLAKSYYKLGDYEGVEIIARNFFTKHPDSEYLDDMHQVLADSYFKQKQYRRAVEEWYWVIQNSRDPRLKKMDGNYIYQTLLTLLSSDEISRLQRRFSDEIFNGLVTVVRAEKLMREGETTRARDMLEAFLSKQPNHFYAAQARKLLQAEGKPFHPGNYFLYLKPVSGEYSQVGSDLELGLRYALWEYQTRHNDDSIALKTIDVGETVLSSVKPLYDEMQYGIPRAILGPIDQDQSVATALVSRYEKIPHIIPLNSQNGLTELSPFAFQLNPDVETKGRFLGEYAVQELNLKRFAVLAPVSEYGKEFFQSFLEAVQANGGEIVTDQWYYEDTQDFSRQFKAIRYKSFWVSFTDSISQVDSAFSEEQLKEYFEKYLERVFGESKSGLKIDSTQVPATGIDGILIVISSPDLIPFIAPQFAFNNIQAIVLGNEGWNAPEQLLKFKNYLDGLVYLTAGFYDPQSWNYKEFTARFRQQMGATPQLYHLLGYDMMKWVLSNYDPNLNPEAFREKLAHAPQYNGILEKIQFGEKPRVNNQLIVLKFSLGHLIRLN